MSQKNGKVEDDGPLVYTEEDLAPKQEPVTLGKTQYLLIGGSAEVVARYQSAIRRGMRVGKNADSVEFSDAVSEADLVLVAGCLCQTAKDRPDVVSRDPSGNPNTVGLAFVKRLPYHVQDRLYKRAKRLTPGLEDPEPAAPPKTPEQVLADEERALGNSPRATTSVSG